MWTGQESLLCSVLGAHPHSVAMGLLPRRAPSYLAETVLLNTEEMFPRAPLKIIQGTVLDKGPRPQKVWIVPVNSSDTGQEQGRWSRCAALSLALPGSAVRVLVGPRPGRLL